MILNTAGNTFHNGYLSRLVGWSRRDGKPATPEAGAHPQPVFHSRYETGDQGISFSQLFGRYLSGAQKVRIVDPYIRTFFQAMNLMEFLVAVADAGSTETRVAVHLQTSLDPEDATTEGERMKQIERFQTMTETWATAGIDFTWEIVPDELMHPRSIEIDGRWKIIIDRGLDIFGRVERWNTFCVTTRVQRNRPVRAFEMTVLQLR